MIWGFWEYVKIPRLTGELETDVKEFLFCNDKKKTFQHVSQVAEVCGNLAERFGLDRKKCVVGALLHDVSAVIAPEDMMGYTLAQNFALCEAERRYPFLLHQRISAIVAKDWFGIDDREVLSAIGCHTTLKAKAMEYDMVLFVADKIAWDQEGIPPFYNEVNYGLTVSLERACYEYMKYMNDNGKILCPHTDWNLAYDYLRKRI